MKKKRVLFTICFLFCFLLVIFIGTPLIGFYLGYNYIDFGPANSGMWGPDGFYELKSSGSYELVPSVDRRPNKAFGGFLVAIVIFTIEAPLIYGIFGLPRLFWIILKQGESS